MQKLILCLAVMALSGCANKVTIMGSEYPLNEQGQLELTEEQLKAFEKSGVPIITESAPGGGREIDPDAFNLLKEDSRAFDAVLFPDKAVEKAIELEVGSLKQSLATFANKYQLELQFDSVDYYVEQPAIVTGEAFIDVLYEALKPFPLKVFVDEGKIIVVPGTGFA